MTGNDYSDFRAPNTPSTIDGDSLAGEESPPEFLKKISTEVTKEVLSMSTRMTSAPLFPPYYDKINENHIDKIIAISSKEVEQDHEYNSSNRWFMLVVFLVIVAALCGILYFLVTEEQQGLLNDILLSLVSLIGGFGGGYGYKSYLERHR